MDLTITIPLTDEQLAGLKHVAGEQSVEDFIATTVQVQADNAIQRKKDAERAENQAAFESLPEGEQAIVGAIVRALPKASPEVQAEVLGGAVKIAEALGIDPSGLKQ